MGLLEKMQEKLEELKKSPEELEKFLLEFDEYVNLRKVNTIREGKLKLEIPCNVLPLDDSLLVREGMYRDDIIELEVQGDTKTIHLNKEKAFLLANTIYTHFNQLEEYNNEKED